MKALAIVLSVLAALALVATFALVKAALLPWGPLQAFGFLIADALPLTKLADLVLIAALLVSLVAGLGAILSKSRPDDGFTLLMLSLAPPLLGLAAAGYGGLIIHRAIIKSHTTDFRVIAPSLAEQGMVLALGLLAGSVAAILNAALASRRSRDA